MLRKKEKEYNLRDTLASYEVQEITMAKAAAILKKQREKSGNGDKEPFPNFPEFPQNNS